MSITFAVNGRQAQNRRALMADFDEVSRSFGGDAKGWNGVAHSTVPGEKRAELEGLHLNEAHPPQQARS